MSQQLFQQAYRAYLAGDNPTAKKLCQTILKRTPKNADALHLLAILQIGEIGNYEHAYLMQPEKTQAAFQSALQCVRKAVDLQPQNANFLTTLGSFYRISGQYQRAEEAYRKAIKHDPREAIAYDGLGQVMWNLASKEQTRREEAESCFKKAIEINPNLEIAYLSLARLSLELDDPEQAIYYGEQALSRHFSPQATSTLGQAYQRLGKEERAITLYQQAITYFPSHANNYILYANLLLEKGELSNALTNAQRAFELNSENEGILTIFAAIQEDNQHYEAALELYQQAFVKTQHFKWQYYIAANQVKQNLPQAALQTLINALILQEEKEPEKKANYSIAYFERFASNWQQMNQAMDIFQQILDHVDGKIADFANIIIRYALQNILGKHDKISLSEHKTAETYSDYLLQIHYSPAYSQKEIYDAHVSFNEIFALPLQILRKPLKNDLDPDKRLRIGYMSQDFRLHSVAHFIEPILAAHNLSETKIFCYYNNKLEDSATERFKNYCTGGWRHCYDWSDDKLANTIRQDKIDILIDLMGHTGHNRLLVFAHKPAPIQMSYLGYPDTTGLTTIDYRITDALAEPEGAEQFSSERLLRMPDSYFCYHPAGITEKIKVNQLPALENGYITFGSFNLYTKITDDQIQFWAQILAQVSNSKLLLKVHLHGNILSNFKDVIIQRFAYLGIPSERLILQDYTRSLEIALQIYHKVDICLDTHPYSGATTTCESLWMGCPVVSLYGRNHVSRMSLSILTAVGLGEFATSTPEAYVKTAVGLAQDTEKLKYFRKILREKMVASPLINNQKFTYNLEQVFRNIWKEYCLSEQVIREENHHIQELSTQINQSVPDVSLSTKLLQVCPITIATSIAPKELEKQKVAINSWIEMGFKVVSFNNKKEIALLQKEFKAVKFYEVKRDASNDCGKPLIYVNDIFNYFINDSGRIAGIVNSDVFLKNCPNTVRYIITQASIQPIVCSRVDVDHLENKDGTLYRGGFDVFFFSKEMLKVFTEMPFCLGQPWWDYWVPLTWIKKGYAPKYVVSPFAYHLKHPTQWDAHFKFYGTHFIQIFNKTYGPKTYEALVEMSARDTEQYLRALGVEANHVNQFILFSMEWVQVL